ncbi:hypothetical protein HFN_1702 [Helicobacter fennelliae MRY12-0050]|uniref:Uncharacterized protein n=1 Tax=Helicobacter fennelliae MRY12-0050 TaxID=1325130 RepID=T1CMW2_9HELI|nr:hypothetical protein HFN_1702 [Helicobacter fennelliae MRY12-0050]
MRGFLFEIMAGLYRKFVSFKNLCLNLHEALDSVKTILKI